MSEYMGAEQAWEDFQEEYAGEYQADDGVIGGNETEPTWDDGLAEGHETAQYAEQAGFAHALIQGGEDLRTQREYEEAQIRFSGELDAARRDLGRDLSPGEWSYLEWEAQQGDTHNSVTNALIEYHDTHDKTQRMVNSLDAMREASEPDTEEVLPGASENYGLPEGTSRLSPEFRDARTAYMVQADKIDRGLLGEIDDE